MVRDPEVDAELQHANSLSDLYTVAIAYGLDRPLRQPLRRLWDRAFISDAVAASVQKVVSNPQTATVMDFLVDRDAQRALKRSDVPELRRDLLRGVRRLLLEPEGAG